ncbi:MAG: hypothetical protein GF418_14480 [Chitinivibrionales bacterium]|nr:hypothetical protein [Chitinivibrionales bacterium]MBD3396827.1 hypothetical protein [Chitinivibrionales bacterium]
MNISKLLGIGLFLLVLSYVRCTTGGGDDIAGGTGTGNPTGGGKAVVALLADTSADSASMSKTPAQDAGPGPMPPVDLPIDPFPVTDDDSLAFTVTSAVVTVQALYFVPAAGFDCSTLTEDTQGVSCDSNGIRLDGPFEFDLLAGTSEPGIDSLMLPEGEYEGLGLLLRGDSISTVGNSGWPIQLAGTFTYEDTMHNFTILADADQLAIYREPGGPFTVKSDTVTHFVVRLHTPHWLESLAIQSCLADQNIAFDTDGTLTIGPNTGAGPCVGLHAQARANVLNSGRLEIF